jgi:formyl-CoA transferase
VSAPLAGCRVLDLGIITAGAATSALLADLGAEVIKIESPSYRDPFRGWTGSGEPEDQHGFFRFTNRNKVGVSIELKRPEGRDAFMRLLARSDIVLENFRRGVMARLRLDYAQLRAVRPEIILASISSQGETGPDTNYVSFGTTLEAMAGLSWLTGYAGGEPVPSGRDLNYPDQVVAIFAAGMVVTAWRHRLRTGEGAHLDLSQRELTSFLVGEALAAAPVQSARIGNADPSFALQECFLASDGKWVALSVLPGQVASLDRLIGRKEETIERAEAVRRWVAVSPSSDGVHELSRAGIAAAQVLDGPGVLAAWGSQWQAAVARLDNGDLVKGFPFELTREPLTIARAAPKVGADTQEVLQRIAGYTAEETEALLARKVIEAAA